MNEPSTFPFLHLFFFSILELDRDLMLLEVLVGFSQVDQTLFSEWSLTGKDALFFSFSMGRTRQRGTCPPPPPPSSEGRGKFLSLPPSQKGMAFSYPTRQTLRVRDFFFPPPGVVRRGGRFLAFSFFSPRVLQRSTTPFFPSFI